MKSLHIIPRTPEPTPSPSIVEPVQYAPTTNAENDADTLSLEDVKVLLNHYTGRTNTWVGFDQPALEALLNHHKVLKSLAVSKAIQTDTSSGRKGYQNQARAERIERVGYQAQAE